MGRYCELVHQHGQFVVIQGSNRIHPFVTTYYNVIVVNLSINNKFYIVIRRSICVAMSCLLDSVCVCVCEAFSHST